MKTENEKNLAAEFLGNQSLPENTLNSDHEFEEENIEKEWGDIAVGIEETVSHWSLTCRDLAKILMSAPSSDQVYAIGQVVRMMGRSIVLANQQYREIIMPLVYADFYYPPVDYDSNPSIPLDEELVRSIDWLAEGRSKLEKRDIKVTGKYLRW